MTTISIIGSGNMATAIGKILVDISNPFNADASGLVTTPGDSAAQEIAAAAPEGTAGSALLTQRRAPANDNARLF